MDIQSELRPKPLPSKSTKAVKWFVIWVLGFVILVLGLFLFAGYRYSMRQHQLDAMVQVQKDIQNADYQEAMNDTFGGKTPQETLALYIAAIEKGDYELASKYFIGGNQKKELDSLNKITPEFKKEIISLLNKIQYNNNFYSKEGKYYTVRDPILVDLKQYPNGIWKIIEI